MIIRAARLEDASAIASVHIASWHETYRGIIPDSYLARLDVDEKRAIWAKALSNNQLVAVAEVDSQVVGFANGSRNRDKAAHYPGELYSIYVIKAFHGPGIGRKLFKRVREHLASNSLIPFVTFVLADNPTLGFYKHMGAEVIGEHVEDFDGTALRELQLLWR
jgi:ribosomal protein S18 acetylase RimI-like enzyme